MKCDQCGVECRTINLEGDDLCGVCVKNFIEIDLEDITKERDDLRYTYEESLVGSTNKDYEIQALKKELRIKDRAIEIACEKHSVSSAIIHTLQTQLRVTEQDPDFDEINKVHLWVDYCINKAEKEETAK